MTSVLERYRRMVQVATQPAAPHIEAMHRMAFSNDLPPLPIAPSRAVHVPFGHERPGNTFRMGKYPFTPDHG